MKTAKRATRGFTLLEIMVTVWLVGVSTVYILSAREGAASHAFRAYHKMEAVRLAEHLLADWALEPDLVEDRRGTFEVDGETIGEDAYAYEITVEDFDLSTGRPVEDDDGNALDDPQAANYGDSAAPLFGDEADDNEDDPYIVRRVIMTVYYPNPVDEEPEEIVLERFMPRVVEPEKDY